MGTIVSDGSGRIGDGSRHGRTFHQEIGFGVLASAIKVIDSAGDTTRSV